MHLLTHVLAFGWQPELRGITTVMIGVIVLCGSVYLLLGTNVGARLGFLIAVAGLFGWMMSMGLIWWSYGIGLKGKDPSWKPVEVINDGNLKGAFTSQARVPNIGDATTSNRVDGWILLPEDSSKRGQAVASADDIIVNQAKIFKTGEYQATNVYDYGGQRVPNITIDAGKLGTWNIDYLAFIHKPHYSMVEVKPLVKQNTEAGKAPPRPVIDENQPPRYVVMERDRGSKRWPAALITFGSGIIFGISCWALHKRDQLSVRNRSQKAAPVPATVNA